MSKPIRTDHEILEEILEILRKREMTKVKVVPTIPPPPAIEIESLDNLAYKLNDYDRELSNLVKKGQLDAGDAGVGMLKDEVDNLYHTIKSFLITERIPTYEEMLDIRFKYKKIENRFLQLKERRSLS